MHTERVRRTGLDRFGNGRLRRECRLCVIPSHVSAVKSGSVILDVVSLSACTALSPLHFGQQSFKTGLVVEGFARFVLTARTSYYSLGYRPKGHLAPRRIDDEGIRRRTCPNEVDRF